jgi:hypothetical protein
MNSLKDDLYVPILFQRIVAQNAASVGVMSEDDVE